MNLTTLPRKARKVLSLMVAGHAVHHSQRKWRSFEETSSLRKEGTIARDGKPALRVRGATLASIADAGVPLETYMHNIAEGWKTVVIRQLRAEVANALAAAEAPGGDAHRKAKKNAKLKAQLKLITKLRRKFAQVVELSSAASESILADAQTGIEAKLAAINSSSASIEPVTHYTEILLHRIAFRIRGNDAPNELDDCSIEHIEKLIKGGFDQGELCLVGKDGETEFRGWWSIEAN